MESGRPSSRDVHQDHFLTIVTVGHLQNACKHRICRHDCRFWIKRTDCEKAIHRQNRSGILNLAGLGFGWGNLHSPYRLRACGKKLSI